MGIFLFRLKVGMLLFPVLQKGKSGTKDESTQMENVIN